MHGKPAASSSVSLGSDSMLATSSTKCTPGKWHFRSCVWERIRSCPGESSVPANHVQCGAEHSMTPPPLALLLHLFLTEVFYSHFCFLSLPRFPWMYFSTLLTCRAAASASHCRMISWPARCKPRSSPPAPVKRLATFIFGRTHQARCKVDRLVTVTKRLGPRVEGWIRGTKVRIPSKTGAQRKLR